MTTYDADHILLICQDLIADQITVKEASPVSKSSPLALNKDISLGKFAAMVGRSHPTIWTFLKAVYTEQSNTDEMLLKEKCGDAPPAKRPSVPGR